MHTITHLSQLDLEKTYSYADYLTWQLDQAVELIRGKIWAMSPAPRRRHQGIATQLGANMWQALRKGPCKVYQAPFDVRLYDRRKSERADKDIFTVVQPDLVVVCDPAKLDERGCLGAPDLVVEILSPGNSAREMRTKYALYEDTGVQEYWIVDPEHEVIQQFTANIEGRFELRHIFVRGDRATAHLFPHLEVDLDELFDE